MMKIYEKVYEYFVNQIGNGTLAPGEKLPSLRNTEKTLGVSRTSVETAYLQLQADGYIFSVEKVGYFVSDTVGRLASIQGKVEAQATTSKPVSYKYDLDTIGEDKQVSCLNLWRRYMKSALRQEDRLLSYGENQGEYDLRCEIAAYVRKTRNIICTADDIVIGAGFQNLLQVLIALIPGEKTISFPTKEFADGATIFKNAGFQVRYRDKESHVIYVTPSYMTKWGDVMTMKRRHELIEHAEKFDHLIIEDDYQNEFVYSSKPTPSLYAMTGGERVAFLGSFSRVLLPSVRISYIILPKEAREDYQKNKELYNQTASKAEQIALAQFLRDGHLHRHIRKMRRLYDEKRQVMIKSLYSNFSKDAILVGESGMEVALKLQMIEARDVFLQHKIRVNVIEEMEDENTLLLSCGQIPMEDIPGAIKELKNIYSKHKKG